MINANLETYLDLKKRYNDLREYDLRVYDRDDNGIVKIEIKTNYDSNTFNIKNKSQKYNILTRVLSKDARIEYLILKKVPGILLTTYCIKHSNRYSIRLRSVASIKQYVNLFTILGYECKYERENKNCLHFSITNKEV